MTQPSSEELSQLDSQLMLIWNQEISGLRRRRSDLVLDNTR
jgi:hypothetical protein